MMRVLITGATGFLGQHCLARLLGEDCEVHAVSRSGEHRSDRVHWLVADLRDPGQAIGVIQAVRPTHLLHLAWEATPGKYGSSPDNLSWLQASVAMATAFGAGGGKRFVGAGTSFEYDPGDRPCLEDATPIRPASIYGKCKAACWLAIEAVAAHHRFAAAWGRIFLPYGPGDPPARLIPSVLSALAAGGPVETTHGQQQRDLIYATDIADLFLRLLLSSESGAFNIGTGKATKIRSVVELLATRRGGLDRVRFGAIEPPAGDPAVLVADMDKVASRLGWSAPTSIDAGLERVLAAFKR